MKARAVHDPSEKANVGGSAEDRSQISKDVPLSPADIPGLGPIRVRAMLKAGLSTIQAVKMASVEELMAVPGLTSIKANYIHEYMSGFTVDELEAASAVAALQKGGTPGTPLIQWEPPQPVSQISPLYLESVRVLGAIITLLASSLGPQLRNRLVANMDRLSIECQALILNPVSHPYKDIERTLRRMRKLADSLIHAARHSEFDKKDQGKLADDLSEATAWICSLRIASDARSGYLNKAGKDA